MLTGRRIAVTRGAAQAETLAERLRALDAEPLVCPAIAFAPPDDPAPLEAALRQLDRYDWLIVTSGTAADVIAGRVQGGAARPGAVAAVGPKTAHVLAQAGLPATRIPAVYVAEELLAALGDVAGQRILLPQGDLARDALADGLRERGALLDTPIAYHTVAGDGGARLAPHLRAGDVDAVLFSSGSTVRYLLDGLTSAGFHRDAALAALNTVALFSIGPVTTREAARLGVQMTVTAHPHTEDGLVDAICAYFAIGANQ